MLNALVPEGTLRAAACIVIIPEALFGIGEKWGEMQNPGFLSDFWWISLTKILDFSFLPPPDAKQCLRPISEGQHIFGVAR